MPGLTAIHDGGDANSLMSIQSVKPTPDTLSRLVARLRALTLRLLPVEVEPKDLSTPTSRIITPEVISAYTAAAGDFVEALPYCLLRARAEFLWDAAHNPADYDENYGRAIACEVLARRIVHKTAPERLNAVMSTRYKHKQIDGDDSDPASALEMAIDTHCTIFLSSTESQDVVKAIWNGHIVQKSEDDDIHDVDYIPYSEHRTGSTWDHLDPSRLSVPRYQNLLRIVVWLLFLVAYSQAVRQPVERLADPTYATNLDAWEIILYVLGLSIVFEDSHKFVKLLRFVTWRAFSFWNMVAIITDSLLLAAFILRIVGLKETGDHSTQLRVNSFQVLSFVSPLIWMKLVTVFDGYQYVGTMQICVARMLQESGIFFALLSILGLGFVQAMYALDAADGTVESPAAVVNALVQGLLGSPDFERYITSPTGLLMYYLWNIVTMIILLNILISLFSSAYDDVVEDSEAEYLAYFAGKTVGMIRAPDSYVYPAPFNLVEIFLVSPFEFFVSKRTYAQYNRVVMRIVFFIPLTMIALYESFREERAGWVKHWLHGTDQGDDNYEAIRDPEPAEEDVSSGLKISKVPFTELVKVFPNTAQSGETLLMLEVQELRAKLDAVLQKLEGNQK
ncbi:calcium activated cation channel [Dendrothele bispora CBS 962.96]|uniref:Calcium activated cation channel n=1 Tax=Dendrothele bispora (strain CBS 962.96) TaxID=1314807 RepID=A0A4S8MYP6_DENBC|nr:calcium activated cation channel [Dendrothele bispora CBS 962.96]